MKIEIENVYGIRGKKIVLDSHGKSNLIIFAPNGTGKTSLYKGIFDVVNNQQYRGMDAANDVKPNLIATFGEKKYSYDQLNQNDDSDQDLIQFINSKNDTFDLEQIKNVLAYDGRGDKKLISKQIKAFWNKMLREVSQEESYFLKNQLLDIQTIIPTIAKYLAKRSFKRLSQVNQKIYQYKALINKITNVLENNLNAKTIGEYATIRANFEQLHQTSNETLLDIKIINDIKRQKDENADRFGYKKQNQYVAIPAINQQWIKNMQQSYTPEEIELILLTNKIEKLIEKNNNDSYNKKEGTLKKFKHKLNAEIAQLEETKLAIILRKNADQFKQLKQTYETHTNAILTKINQKIVKINHFFMNDTLDWKIKIEPLKHIYDEIKISVLNEENGFVAFETLAEYASEGQKRVLFIIASIINFYGKDRGTIVIDDAFATMDNNHANEVLEVVSNVMFKNIHFLVLSHNFEWIRSVAFHPKIGDNSEFIVMDKQSENEFLILESSRKNISEMMNTTNFNFKNKPLVLEIVILSSISREILANNIANIVLPIRGLDQNSTNKADEIAKKDHINRDLMNTIEFFDRNIRHYKGNVTTSNLLAIFNAKVTQNIQILPIIHAIKSALKKLTKDKQKIFGDVIKNAVIRWDDITSFSEYICNKIFLGTQLRFLSEFKKYYTSRQQAVSDARVLWESKDQWGKAEQKLPPELKNINSFKVNYLAHANNVQWNKIIEIPIYKINKMYN